MAKAQIIGLKTLKLQSDVQRTGMDAISTAIRAHKKRVFTENEWEFLNSLPDNELVWRIEKGDMLIGLLHRPEMMNMNPKEANKISSNLKYQQDAIRSILTNRSKNDG